MQRILLVEDNEMNRDLISRRLKRRGFEVLMAFDGAAGVEAATREKPDLILMDIGLPVLDGYEATRLIKEQESTRLVPVIGLSAHAMSGDADRALEAGCDDYDTKPIEWPRLLGKIQGLLERAAQAEAAERRSEGPTVPSSPGTGVRLLVVNHSAMRTEMVSTRLSAMGHDFEVAPSVEEAVAKIEAQPVDAVLLDTGVPGTEGGSALEQVRAAAGDGIPILMLCAIDAIQDAIGCLERGAAEIVPQPFRAEELRHRLDTQLELARHRSRPAAPDGDGDRRVEHLMRSLMPSGWIKELRESHQLPPRRVDTAALLQWELPNLGTMLASSSVPAMTRLQRVVVGCEELAEKRGVEVVSIDNLGVLSMVDAGDAATSVRRAVRAGLDLSTFATGLGESLRAAVHVGPVVAGVIGHQTWRFGLWGGTVTLAQQTCHSVTPGVHATDTAWQLLAGEAQGEVSGSVAIEGGSLTIHRVDRLL